MPLYEYDCPACGASFTRLAQRPGGPDPDCPTCGASPRRRISTFAVGRRADPGPGREQAPTSWEATNRGDRDTILAWHRALDRRARLEERHPELATPRSPVLAHEGRYEHAPLTAGHPHSHPPPPSGADADADADKDG